MKKRAILLILVLGLMLSPVAAGADAATGEIAVQVVNGTLGDSPVADVEVSLQTYDGTGLIGDNLTGITDEEGTFSFIGIFVDASLTYVATASYQGVDYFSDPVIFPEDQSDQSATITVFDTTESDASLHIPIAHTVIDVGDGFLEITEMVLFANVGDQTYVGASSDGMAGAATVSFSLPVNATGVVPGMGISRAAVTDDHLDVNEPIVPGMQGVSFSYVVPFASEGTIALRTPAYTIDSYTLLVGGRDISASCGRLTNADSVSIEGDSYLELSGSSLDPSTPLLIELAPADDSGDAMWPWVLIGLMVAGGGALAAFLLTRRRRAAPIPSSGGDSDGSLTQSRQRLLEEIAQLDDEFEAGRVPLDVYHRKRAEKKATLVKIIEAIEGRP